MSPRAQAEAGLNEIRKGGTASDPLYILLKAARGYAQDLTARPGSVARNGSSCLSLLLCPWGTIMQAHLGNEAPTQGRFGLGVTALEAEVKDFIWSLEGPIREPVRSGAKRRPLKRGNESSRVWFRLRKRRWTSTGRSPTGLGGKDSGRETADMGTGVILTVSLERRYTLINNA